MRTGLMISIILLCATLFDIFQYVLPVGLILVGVSVVIRISMKKKEGYKHSIDLSKEYNLYRQDYCGCIYSKEQREQEKANKNTD